jgi:hypothetical protein
MNELFVKQRMKPVYALIYAPGCKRRHVAYVKAVFNLKLLMHFSNEFGTSIGWKEAPLRPIWKLLTFLLS